MKVKIARYEEYETDEEINALLRKLWEEYPKIIIDKVKGIIYCFKEFPETSCDFTTAVQTVCLFCSELQEKLDKLSKELNEFINSFLGAVSGWSRDT